MAIYSDAVKVSRLNINVISGPFSQRHGDLKFTNLSARLMSDAQYGVCPQIVNSLNEEPVENGFELFGLQPMTSMAPHEHAFEEKLNKLQADVDGLESDINGMKVILESTSFRPLIEIQRYCFWRKYRSDFEESFPEGVVKRHFVSTTEGLISEFRPSKWSAFLDFVVREKLGVVPIYWELLYGEYGTDVRAFSDVIRSLPDKDYFLRVLRPTGVYAELFAAVYGVSVEASLAEARNS